MEIRNYNKKRMNTLKPYLLHKDINNRESNLFLDEKNPNELLKIFKSGDTDYLLNKFYTINLLFQLSQNLELKEFVFPYKLIKFEGIPAGFSMPLINKNVNFNLIFKNKKISNEDKLFYLKKISKILEKISQNKICKELNFFLGDIHEGNFIYDIKNNYIKVVDLDSAKIGKNESSISKFLYCNDKLWDFPEKYPFEKNTKIHQSNQNTTILSFIYILLNTISGEYFPDIQAKPTFIDYLNFLMSKGVNKKLLDAIITIYKNEDNYFDTELLNYLTPNILDELKFSEYKKVKK